MSKMLNVLCGLAAIIGLIAYMITNDVSLAIISLFNAIAFWGNKE